MKVTCIEYRDHFAVLLYHLRVLVNITQSELADELGISQQTYSGYENNSHFPSMDILIKIADFYDVSVDWLIGRETLN